MCGLVEFSGASDAVFRRAVPEGRFSDRQRPREMVINASDASLMFIDTVRLGVKDGYCVGWRVTGGTFPSSCGAVSGLVIGYFVTSETSSINCRVGAAKGLHAVLTRRYIIERPSMAAPTAAVLQSEFNRCG